MRIVNQSEMVILDRKIMKDFSISQPVLMENAGISFCTALVREIKDIYTKNIIVVCGPGNNGGDGFVIARQLLSKGIKVAILQTNSKNQYQGAAKLNQTILQKLVPSFYFASELSPTEISEIFSQNDIIIDAIFGVGLKRDIEGNIFNLIKLINQSGTYIGSVDIPSGIDASNGNIRGIAVNSDITVMMGYIKTGNCFHYGYAHSGKLFLSSLSFSNTILNKLASKHTPNSTFLNLPTPLPDRTLLGHKSSFGQVLFISGSENYFGAPYFSSYSFLKSGGGYSRLAAPASVCRSVAINAPEVVLHPYVYDKDILSADYLSEISNLMETQDCVVIGPGLSQSTKAQQLLTLALNTSSPLLIDGDGLTLLGTNPSILESRKSLNTILTPHMGEMSRITGLTIAKIENDPIEIARNFSKDWNVILVLKGPRTIISSPEGKVWINLTGNEGLATAGTGDVLTGIIAALISNKNLEPYNATRLAVFIHGMAGDLAKKNIGSDGITASNILGFLPDTFKYYRYKYNSQTKQYLPASITQI